jgi:hypothetical protein
LWQYIWVFCRSKRENCAGPAGQPETDTAKTPLFLFSDYKDQRDTRDERNSSDNGRHQFPLS